jgi:hypothetical protein
VFFAECGGVGRDRVNEAMRTLYSGGRDNEANKMTERSGEVKYRWLVQPGRSLWVWCWMSRWGGNRQASVGGGETVG